MKRMFKALIIIIGFIGLVISFRYDSQIIVGVIGWRQEWLNPIVLLFTFYGLTIAIPSLLIYLFAKKDIIRASLIMLSCSLALEMAFLMKYILKIPRPYQSLDIMNLAEATQTSFPSGHSTFAFAVLPFLSKKTENIRFLWIIFAILMAMSRVYIGVHFMSDVVAGALLGLVVGEGLRILEERYKFLEKFWHHIRDKFELRRQIAHAITGIAIIALFSTGILQKSTLLLITLIGGILSLIAKKHRLPLLEPILEYFERPKHREKFPGRGSFFLVLGSLIVLTIYPEKIAFAAILITAIGDSVTNIFGRYFGSVENPLNRKKNLEGTMMSIFLSTLVALFFVPMEQAFMASTVAMFFESLDIKIGKFELDDNLLIPLIAGWMMV